MLNVRLILSALTLALSLLAPMADAVTCAPNLLPNNPDASYTDNGDGTVTHRPTGLMWKRCSEGQTWTGSTCTGTASALTWPRALAVSSTSNFAGQSDWRLPNIKELRSLVEECRYGPSINNTIFPSTPSSAFWSGSPEPILPTYASNVYFDDGIAYVGYKTNASRVRLVRSGQSFGAFDSQSEQTPPEPVILVHGINSSSATWANFRDKLINSNARYGGSPAVSNGSVLNVAQGDFYALDFSDSNDLTFQQQGWELAKIIDEVKRVNNAAKVVLVAHSMGGLAARAYLQGFARSQTGESLPYNDDVEKLITVGTPHQGSPWPFLCQGVMYANIVCAVWGGGTSVAMDMLKADSPELGQLNSNTRNLPPINYVSIVVDGMFLSVAGIDEDGDGIVSVSSQNLALVAVGGLPTNISLLHKALPSIYIDPWCGGPLLLGAESHTCEPSNSSVQAAILSELQGTSLSINTSGVTTPPTCTLVASPVVISAGSSSTLTASCTPAATSYVWTGSTCAGTTAVSCTVTPAASTTYTVAGINASGTGTVVSTTVMVSNSFPGSRSNYSITKTSTGFSVTDKLGAGGAVALTGATQIRFADMTVNLLIGDLSKTIPADTLKSLIELYVAFFNRIPGSDGLSYWITQFKAGSSINQIAESFYAAGIQYSSLTGFSSGMTPDDFINTVYRNVLDRPAGADADGLAYWRGKLLDGSATHGSLVTDILFAAHSYKADPTWHWVPDLLDNKYSVATFFCLQQGLNYNTPEIAIAEGMAIAAAVTPTSTAAAIALIEVTDAGFDLTAP